MNRLYARTIGKFLQFPIMVGVLCFLPAGTLDYWEAWFFSGVFIGCAIASTIYLAIKDPALLDRRLAAGPSAEKEPFQKILMVFAIISFAGILVLSAVDHRFDWSQVPLSVVVLGNLLVVLGFLGVHFVMKENTFAASNISIAPGHTVISTGPYAVVRHPMYSYAVLMLAGVPLALGSWWGLLFVIPTVSGITVRLLHEERFLKRNLPGYVAYTEKVRYRLLPGVW
jgi:protein-S-isoprenylcysteine O-methyltransferase Ste14